MTSGAGSLSGTTIGRYRVGALLGQGGMGEVYRADDTDLARGIALKVLPQALVGDPDRLARFVQEARTASALNHPHLISIYEIGEARPSGLSQPVHYIAMELVVGETLRQLIDSNRIDLRKLADYFSQAADALAAAHAAGIVHRDLKPENVMVADAGYAKVLDFGVAKLRPASPFTGSDEHATVTAGTAPGVILGTVGYMSPEQARGDTVDHRTDIFSFGCMLYETAAGARPFGGGSTVDILHRIIHEEPPPLPATARFPAELQRIIRKCLAKDPGERYQSMKEVALDLRALRRELDTSATTPILAAGAAPRKSVRLAAAEAVLVLAAILGVLWFATRSQPEPVAAPLDIVRITRTGTVIDAAISPDGNYLAYVESSAGKQSLWLRQVAGTRPILLDSPTGGFWGATFSKDGASIYYSVKNSANTTGTLYSIPVLGGMPAPLLQRIDSTVTFSPDGGQLAYLRIEADGASSLMIAGANGRDPRVLATRRPPEFFAPGFFVAPSWSPDGKRIAAAVRNTATRDAGIFTFDVADGSAHPLPARYAEASFTQWRPDGRGLFVIGRMLGVLGTGNGGQIWLQPYPSGELRRITSDMIEYRNASLTRDGRTMVAVGFEASTGLSIVSLETGEERVLPAERSDGGPGVAWDGQQIFYVKALPRELQIWTMKTDGSDPRELIRDVRPALAVSPDGRTLVYSAERDGRVQLLRADVNGRDVRPLAPVPDATWLTFSPDGRWVLFTSSKDGEPATYKVPVEGGEPALVARDFQRAVVSFDGGLVAGVHRSTGQDQDQIALAVLSLADGRVVHRLPGYAPATGSGGFAWAPDDASLFFTSVERMNIWKWTFAGGEPRKVTNFSERAIIRLALSPDGKSALVSRGNAVRDAFLFTNLR